MNHILTCVKTYSNESVFSAKELFSNATVKFNCLDFNNNVKSVEFMIPNFEASQLKFRDFNGRGKIQQRQDYFHLEFVAIWKVALVSLSN